MIAQQQMLEQQMLEQQMIAQQQMMQQAPKIVQNNFNNERNNIQINEIMVIFKKSNFGDRKAIPVRCKMNEKVSSIIKKYRNLSGDYDNNRIFIFNAISLTPDLTVAEAGLGNISNHILVYETGQVKGSKKNNISIFN